MSEKPTTTVSPSEAVNSKNITSEKVTKQASVTMAENTTSSSSPKVKILNQLFDGYVTVRTGSKDTITRNGKSLTYAERSINAIIKLFDFVYNNQEDVAVLNELRRIFINNRTGYLSSETALQGINYVTSIGVYNRISTIWILFYDLTSPAQVSRKIDYSHPTKYLTNPNCKHPTGIVEYISQRMS